MRYHYMAVYKILGLTWPEDHPDCTLVELPSQGAVALLTGDADRHCAIVDRDQAYRALLMSAIFGPPEEGDFRAKLSTRITRIEEERRKHGTGAFLVFDADGEIEVRPMELVGDYGEFAFCDYALDKEAIRERHKPAIAGVLTTLSLRPDIYPNVRKITDAVYLVADGEKTIHVSTLSSSATGHAARAVLDDDVRFVAEHAARLVEDPELTRVTRLLTQSLGQHADNLRAFLFAWTALEIFVNKAFKVYEQRWLSRFTGSNSPALSGQFFERVQEVLRDKYRLADKFLVTASLLSPDTAEADIAAFKTLKVTRDKLTHGEFVRDEDLPTDRVQDLLRLYLRLHLEAAA